MVNSTYCRAACSRPATSEEQTADYRAREAAIEEAERRGTHSARQLDHERDVLAVFEGYRRCTKDD